MSLGWSTESALLPSKAKPIAINSQSMIGLKAAVYEGEQKLSSRGKRSISELRQQQRFNASNRSLPSSMAGDDAPAADRNKGVAARKERDERELADAGPVAGDKVVSALRAKSELYDNIKAGVIPVDSNSCLVDFHHSKAGSGSRPIPPLPDPVVPISISEPSPAWSWSRGDKADGAGDDRGVGGSNDEPTSVADYKRRKISENSFMQRVKEELVKHASLVPAQDGEGRGISGAAKVKSQWEKTLTGTSRELLEQIHVETEMGRKAAEMHGHTTDGGGSSVGVPVKSAREMRLRMIKEKQEQLQQQRSNQK